MKKTPFFESVLNALYLVLSDNTYLVLILISMLLFGLSYAILPILLIPGARLSFSSLMNSFSTVDLILLTVMSLMFGLVTAMQVYEIRKIAKGFKAKQGATLGATIAGLVAAKSCCILPLVLLAFVSISSALLISSHLTEIRTIAASIMSVVFGFTATRIGNCVGLGETECQACEA